MEKLVILDAHAIIHRAYHALPSDFLDNKGNPVGALYGLCLMILSIKDTIKPDYIVAAYDLPGKHTFRHIAYDQYKTNRKKTDSELKYQLQESRKLCELFNIPIYDKPGYEADDIIGTIATKLLDTPNLQVIIASGDMDTMQLINDDKIVVHTLKKGIKNSITYNEEKAIERFGFHPKYLPDYKGLRGDPSDNIKGIKGIGEKTATILIQNYHTIENIYKQIETDESKLLEIISPRILNLLKEHKEDAIFSKLLATIRTDADIDFKLPPKWDISQNINDLLDYLEELNFKSIIARLKQDYPQQSYDFIKFIPQREREEIKIAFWLLNSEYTNPDLNFIVRHIGAKNANELKQKLINQLKKDEDLYNVYQYIELPIIDVVKFINSKGILVDKKHFEKLLRQAQKELNNIEKLIYKEAGTEFNINSPQQLSEILYNKLHISTNHIKKTSTGKLSTKESELQKIKDQHPIVQLILQHRKINKLITTYIEPLIQHTDKNNIIKTTLIQTGTATGRFSSVNPNLQNLPREQDDGYSIRQGFIARPNKIFIRYDYSQIELRVAAILSSDQKMIEMFNSGKDFHTAVASKIFGVSHKKVTKEQRRKAKTINFSILYGVGIKSLSKSLGTNLEEARNYQNAYFSNFPQLKEFLDNTKDFARKNGYTRTLFGRIRKIPNINSHIYSIRSQAERMAINSPIQGTATGDIIKLALKDTWNYIQENNLLEQIHPLLQIHDEILFEADKNIDKNIIIDIKNLMENVLQNSYKHINPPIPLTVDTEIGPSYGETKPIQI